MIKFTESLDEPHPRWPNSTRREISEKRRRGRRSSIAYPLTAIEQRADGWYAIYSNSSEYTEYGPHESELDCRRSHGCVDFLVDPVFGSIVERRTK